MCCSMILYKELKRLQILISKEGGVPGTKFPQILMDDCH